MDVKPMVLGIAFTSVAFIFFSQKRMNEKLKSHDIEIMELYDHAMMQQRVIDKMSSRIFSISRRLEAQRDRIDRINTLVWESVI